MTMPHPEYIEAGEKASGKLELPVIDFSVMREDQDGCRRQMINSLQEFGIFALGNLPTINFDDLKVYIRWFFYLPSQLKRKISRKFNLINDSGYRIGYFRLKSMYSSDSYDEIYAMDSDCLDKYDIWPDAPGREEFKLFIRDSFFNLQSLAKTIRQVILSDLEVNSSDSCDDICTPRLSLVRDASTKRPTRHTHFSRTNSLDKDSPTQEKEDCCDLIVEENCSPHDCFVHIVLPLDDNEVRWLRCPDGSWSQLIYPPKSLLICGGKYLSKYADLKLIEQRSADYMSESYSLSFML